MDFSPVGFSRSPSGAGCPARAPAVREPAPQAKFLGTDSNSGEPIPVVFGTAMIRNVMVLWYGQIKAVKKA